MKNNTEDLISLDEITHIEVSTEAIALVQSQEITVEDFYLYCYVNLVNTAGHPIDDIVNREDLQESMDRLFESGLLYEDNEKSEQ